VRYVRFGPQFCVRDAALAACDLAAKDFRARCTDPLLS